jgi:hypothetical protein
MTVDLPSYSRDELDQTARNLLRTRRRGVDLSLASDWDITARLLGAVTWLALEQAKVARRLLARSRAFDEALGQFVLEAGVGRSLNETTAAATKATGKVILLSETVSQTQPAGSVLRHADGTEYTLDADVTTPATATKVLRAGLRSGRRRLYQGHRGAGFVTAAAGEVYLFGDTGEYCALKDVENGVTLQRHLFDLFNDLDADPKMHDQFSQQLGAIGNITASSVGAAGNKDAKDVLTLVSPAGTILAEAIILYTAGGADAMSSSSMQGSLRALSVKREGFGTIQSIRELALSYPGADIRECYAVPAADGVGTYSLMPIRADGQYIGANMLAELIAWLSARTTVVARYSGATVTEEVDTELAALSVNVSSTLPPDWQLPDPSTPLTVVASVAADSLTFASLDGLSVGVRMIVTNRGSSGPYIVQRRVTGLSGVTMRATLDAPLPFPADAGDAFVTPGGPLGDAIIDALYAAYEQQAPQPTTEDTVRLPLPVVPDGPDGILAAVSDVPGVTDVDFVPGAPSPVGPAIVLVPACTIFMTVERV